AGQGLNSRRYYDERFPLKNVSALLKHGELRPRHTFYLSLSYLPQAGVLAASEWLYEITRYQPFSIYGVTGDGYSPTAYWLCRMVNVFYGTLSLWLLFLIGRRIDSPEVGLLAAAIFAAFPRHVLSSVEFKPDILVILLVTLTFYWTLGAAFRPSLRRFLLAGVGVGLAVSTKYTGIAAAIPVTAAALANGWRDRRQWLRLVLAGVASVVTFVILNPFLDVVFEFIPKLVHGYAAKGVTEKSNRWVVFQRQVEFLVEHHGPLVAAFVGLGVGWLLWRLFRPAPGDSREWRLGWILALSLLLGYSVLHSLGMTLFRGQNYLPVVPASSLIAGWAMVELWRTLARRARWLAWEPVAAAAGIAVVGLLAFHQGRIVYSRVVPTNFAVVNDALMRELDPVGLRHVVYEGELGAFESGGKPRRPLVSRVERLATQDPRFLDGTDVEVFPQSRLGGPAADFYRARLARVPRSRVEVVASRPFRSRGEPVVVVHHPWVMQGGPLEMRVRRPDEVPYLVGRLPEGIVQPGEAVSLLLWVPREAMKRKTWELRLDPGGRAVSVFDTGRRLNRFFRLSARTQLTGQEVRVRVPAVSSDRPRGFGVELYRWRPAPAPAAQ
ncbi:MAG TPA: glycosyltransferase family 39 protein, partial [Thermoanaerobaculia bacterium]|nr:glycosyltransferase family 39 protein [Thermoanaerobaculia bacterium]